jgi:hypothetical protein
MGTTTTFAALIAAPQSEKVFLAELLLAEQLQGTLLKAWGTGYSSAYPPAFSSTYVKATTEDPTFGKAYYAADPTKPLIGWSSYNSWQSYENPLIPPDYPNVNQRFHYDLGSGKVINRIYYENIHHNGTGVDVGVKNFTFWGSNSATAFADLVYSHDTDWTELTCSQNTFDQHAASDTADPKFIAVTNSTSYRYYAFKFADNWGYAYWMGVRRIELQVAYANSYDLTGYLNETITMPDGSTETVRKEIVACEVNGTALTEVATSALVESTSGSWFHDTANQVFYLHCSDDGSPSNDTVIVYFWVYFATKGIVLDGRYYEPYIAQNGIPSLSQASQQIHWGASQISSGAVVLLNNRGIFDQIARRWIWNNKTAKILLGGDSLAYSEYTTVFVGKILQTEFTKDTFTLDIQSKAFDLLRSLPINSYWKTTYANLDPNAEGRPIPYFWGSYDVTQAPICTCINSAYAANTYQFKICDTTYHAIKDISAVYVDLGNGAGWQAQAFANEDLTNATFTIVNASFVLGTSRVKAVFEGYASGGVLIEGAPEIVEDILLNQCGYAAADLNAASFTASKARSDCQLNVGVENVTAALTIIEQICQSDLAYFDEDNAGLLRYRTWEPVPASTANAIDKRDIIEMPQISEDTSRLYYKIKVGYSFLHEKGQYLYTEYSNNESRYKYERSDYLTINTYHRTKASADDVARRLNWITRNPSPIISVTLKAGLIDLTLGDLMKVTLDRAPFATAGGYDERVFEIISKDVSCFPLLVKLQARDLMDFGGDVGFWMGASAPAWDDATETERLDSGFWCDADGFCYTGDDSSLNKSLWW